MYNIHGAINAGLGRLDDAIEAYKNAVAVKPDYADAYNNMGNVLKRQGKLKDAIEAYKKALLIQPNYVEVMNNMGNAFKDQGKVEDAIQAYKRLSRLTIMLKRTTIWGQSRDQENLEQL